MVVVAAHFFAILIHDLILGKGNASFTIAAAVLVALSRSSSVGFACCSRGSSLLLLGSTLLTRGRSRSRLALTLTPGNLGRARTTTTVSGGRRRSLAGRELLVLATAFSSESATPALKHDANFITDFANQASRGGIDAGISNSVDKATLAGILTASSVTKAVAFQKSARGVFNRLAIRVLEFAITAISAILGVAK